MLPLDLYARERAPDARPAPIVVLVHGGGWSSGSPEDWPQLARYLAAQGYLVAMPEYRLAPQHRFPAAVDDVRAAVDFLRGRATTWGGDADGVVLLGRSAGAHLALLVGYTSTLNAVRGVVSIYGPADLLFGWQNPGNARVYDGVGAIEAFLGGPPSAVPEAYSGSSAYDRVGAGTPPTLLIHGSKDELVWVEQSRRLARRLQEAGRPHLLVELPWATHGCDIPLAGPCGQVTLYTVERFLAAVTAH
jgi:acetyl esterase/lipase